MRDLRRFFEKAPRKPFTGAGYRIIAARYRLQPLSMRGSLGRGGRYNVRDQFGCLYLSDSQDLAMREMKRYFTIPPDEGFLCAQVHVQLTNLVDLMNPMVRQLGEFTLEDLVQDDWIPTSAIATHAWEAGVEGLVVPSVVSHSEPNLAVFLDNQHPGWAVGLGPIETAAWG